MLKKFKRMTWPFLMLCAALFPYAAMLIGQPYLVRVGGVVGLFALLGIGLNFTIGYVGLFDLGYIAFYAVGAYAAAIAVKAGVPTVAAIGVAIVAATLMRAFLGITILRLKGDYLAVVTMGFAEIIRLSINNLDALTNGPKGLQVASWQPLPIWGVDINVQFYGLIWAFVAASILVSLRLERSRVGRAWVAIREDEIAARLSGIAVRRYKLMAFIMSGVFAGLAGALFALWEQFVTPESFVFWESILVVAIVVLGGIGSVPGAVVGAMILAGIPPMLQAVLSSSWINYRYIFFGAILVLMTLFRPQGILPSKRHEAELTQ